MVCPKEPIGPDGGGSSAVRSCAPLPVVADNASPVDGCFDTGVISAARASSGVGMLAKSVDWDEGWGAAPRLICPVFGTKPGLVAVGLSSAWIDAFNAGKARAAASTVASP